MDKEISRNPNYKITFLDAIVRFWKGYFKFSGRATRAEFLYAELFLVKCNFVVGFISAAVLVLGKTTAEYGYEATLLLSNGIKTTWAVATFFPSLALWCRRFHDFGAGGLLVVVWQLASISVIVSEFYFVSFESELYFVLLEFYFVLFGISLVFSICFFLVAAIRDSQKGKNKFGDSEKYPEESVPAKIDEETTASGNIMNKGNSINPNYKITFLDAVVRFWKGSFKFSGRATRAEFLYAELFLVICTFVVCIVSAAVLDSGKTTVGYGYYSYPRTSEAALLLSRGINITWELATFFPMLALWCRRYHDFGVSGWNLFGVMVVGIVLAFVGGVAAQDGGVCVAILFFVCGCSFLVAAIRDSQKGKNKFGDSEKYPEGSVPVKTAEEPTASGNVGDKGTSINPSYKTTFRNAVACFRDAVVRFWKGSFEFSGRATRAEFLYAMLFCVICSVAVYFVAEGVLASGETTAGYDGYYSYSSYKRDPSEGSLYLSFGIKIAWVIATFSPVLALGARRFHDFGKSGWYFFGWWIFGTIAAVIGVLVSKGGAFYGILAFVAFAYCFLVAAIRDSQKGKNKFGDSEKYPEEFVPVKIDEETPADVPNAEGAAKFCPHCGNKVAEGFAFCPYCGGKQPKL